MVQWVKREATVLKDYQDWKDHPDLRDLKAKLDPKATTDLWEYLVLLVLLESCLYYHRNYCSSETLRVKDAVNVTPSCSRISKIVINVLLLSNRTTRRKI